VAVGAPRKTNAFKGADTTQIERPGPSLLYGQRAIWDRGGRLLDPVDTPARCRPGARGLGLNRPGRARAQAVRHLQDCERCRRPAASTRLFDRQPRPRFGVTGHPARPKGAHGRYASWRSIPIPGSPEAMHVAGWAERGVADRPGAPPRRTATSHGAIIEAGPQTGRVCGGRFIQVTGFLSEKCRLRGQKVRAGDGRV